ncbi:thioesterase II family protein [Dictyobacter arantiisoli]|uniref:Thioesterase n=1 Tax=Dictyobacter arantiisoli TaxID=2014874 RepID=A0A5A5T7T3_9CHLR|nr:thioesterase domain-containing protein [Dictyobacter arantiisoli]GCF07276.1 thioesterase [Dictyobacter arantiisoli]
MSSQPNNKSWLFFSQQPRHDTRVRLFCLPYAGGGASIYNRWAEELPTQIELCALQLPGRENRFVERPFTNLNQVVETLLPIIKPYLDVPFAFFGHSMGSLISFELTRAIRNEYSWEPACLFVSGHRAPHVPRERKILHTLPTPDFIREVRKLNGTPEELLQSSELLELFLPLLRADFELCETYSYKMQAQLTCPIVAFGGLQDEDVPRDALGAWHEQTSAHFCRRLFHGDHFFLHQHRRHLTKFIAQRLLHQNTTCQSCGIERGIAS